ncbi:chorismate--pyruvate lyase family protein [Pseudoalteromonas phenolica]|uniref:chorismate--pyruvate lyase family protein n=1 Tax=Pseudoalteromonas phenolica TaxID=161398 RepID=UPI0013EEBE40|nr:chorismate lyase [Pseudoalteromonas phenolica]
MLKPPISIDYSWRSSLCELAVPAALKPILGDTGSLTARLKSKSEDFKVLLLNEQPIKAKLLGNEYGDYICREVLLLCDDVIQVYAQSWISLPACEKGVEQLGETPLGEVLFQNALWQRSELELAEVESREELAQLLNRSDIKRMPIFARRRIFSQSDAHVMVCEVFLPEVLDAT